MSKSTMLICSAMLILVVVVQGCSKKDNTPSPSDQKVDHGASSVEMEDNGKSQEGSIQAGAFNEALKLWTAGQKDESVRMLLNLNWSNPDLFEGEPALTLSEAEFVKLSASERQAIQAKALVISKDIRMITKHMVGRANRLVADNQVDQAELYQQTLAQLSGALAAPDKLKLMQMVGDAVGKYVTESTVGNKAD